LFTVEDTFWRWFQALVAATDPRFGVVRGGRRWIFSVSGDRRRRPEVQGDLCCNFQLFQGVSCKPPGMYCALLIKFRFSQKKKWGRGLCWLRREVGWMSFFIIFSMHIHYILDFLKKLMRFNEYLARSCRHPTEIRKATRSSKNVKKTSIMKKLDSQVLLEVGRG